jgi:hypothetical protein
MKEMMNLERKEGGIKRERKGKKEEKIKTK